MRPDTVKRLETRLALWEKTAADLGSKHPGSRSHCQAMESVRGLKALLDDGRRDATVYDDVAAFNSRFDRENAQRVVLTAHNARGAA